MNAINNIPEAIFDALEREFDEPQSIDSWKILEKNDNCEYLYFAEVNGVPCYIIESTNGDGVWFETEEEARDAWNWDKF